MKRLFAMLAIAVGIGALGFAACGDENDTTDGELKYEKIVGGNGETVAYAVSGVTEDAGSEPVIPSEYRNLSVTRIAADAFKGCTQIESITIGENIAEIAAGAFAQCTGLQSVKVASAERWLNISFESVSSNPMYFASKFYAGGELIEELVVPDSVTAIPDYAFYMCENLVSVSTGKGVTEIGSNAFYGCDNLESVEIAGKVEKMGDLAFADCPALSALQIGGEVGIIGEYAFLNCASINSVTVPSGVERIEEAAFMSCTGITSLKLNEGLKYIGDSAFADCSSLSAFDMPSSVTEIGFGVIMFGGSSGFDNIGGIANQVSEITLSDKLTEIPDFAFSFCSIKTVALGDEVTKINYSSFYGCDKLESVVLPRSLENIVSYAFYKCYSLNTVYYKGTPEEWKEVKIGKSGNDNFTGAHDTVPAEIYYYSEAAPAGGGKFWHYVGGVPTKW